ncbi:MAG: hypothetical protein SH868_05980 [Bythopirellula sp.]|nr:hypothetical protein [Bythopirellula sp.]
MLARTLFPLTAILVSFVSSSSAATFNLGPTADALVSAANPTNNYGGAGAFAISAIGLPKGEFQSLLKFDLATAKASFDTTFGSGNWTLDGATLQLTAANPGNALFNASAAGQIAASWMQNDSWVEGSGTPAAPAATGITFSTLPAFLSGADQSLGTFGFVSATSGLVSYSLEFSSGLAADALAGEITSLRLLAGNSTIAALFNSRTFNTATGRPVLILNAMEIPEPASCVLLGFGMLMVTIRPSISSRT